jgi:hypothetical protein
MQGGTNKEINSSLSNGQVTFIAPGSRSVSVRLCFGSYVGFGVDLSRAHHVTGLTGEISSREGTNGIAANYQCGRDLPI